jgi:hypothetical protein
MVHEISKDGLHLPASVFIRIMDFRMAVEPFVEMSSQRRIPGF